MPGDYSRKTFNSKKDYSGVLMQQGRVQLDADWNEQDDIINRRLRVETIDIGGRCFVPKETEDGFKIEVSNGTLTFGCGRIYVDGILADNHQIRDSKHASPPSSPPESNAEFDRALAEERGIIPVPYDDQPYYPDPPDLPVTGTHIVYIDVWDREVTYLEDPGIVEKAVNVDTTTRRQTVYQVKLLQVPDEITDITCSEADDFLKNHPDLQPSGGRLTSEATGEDDNENPCLLPPKGGYRGLENQLYRVEIHDGGEPGAATFKWSRDNGIVATKVLAISGVELNVESIGRDAERSFKSGDWVEIIDDNREFSGKAGEMRTITVDPDSNTISINSALPGDMPSDGAKERNTRVRRWDQNGEVQGPDGAIIVDLNDSGSGGVITIPDAGQSILLERGINITFNTKPESGEFRTGDYWNFSARTADGEIEELKEAPPHGIHHHYCCLAIVRYPLVTSPPETNVVVTDCRKLWPPEINKGCCVVVKAGDDLLGVVNKVAETGGGCICLLPGDHNLAAPIRMVGNSSIQIKGFGLVTRLHISEILGDNQPFILENATDISFENFAIFNSGSRSVWFCNNVKHLEIKKMFVYSSFILQRRAILQPIIANIDRTSHGWLLKSNVFLGSQGLKGSLMAQSDIVENIWIGSDFGIDLVNLINVRMKRNQWIGITGSVIEELDGRIKQAISEDETDSKAILRLIDSLIASSKKFNNYDYIALNGSGSFNVEFSENQVIGSIGISAEIVENCKIDSNEFITRNFGGTCGLVHGLLFTRNRIGEKSFEGNTRGSISCNVGLRIVGDAIDCEILDNAFLNVNEGVMFESDISGDKEVAKTFGVKVLARANIDTAESKVILEESRNRTDLRMSRHRFRRSTYFKIGKCKNTLIQGNIFNADRIGIEWSGTKDIINFRISNNTFTGCQDVAIQIEPDDNIFFLASTVDTKVRLIEKNKFEVYSGAVRATIGAVRIEKNDIRVLSPKVDRARWKDVLILAADHIYKFSPYLEAVKADDIPGLRANNKEVMRRIEKDPDSIDTVNFSKAVEEELLSTYKHNNGDALADSVYVMKALADIDAKNYLVANLNPRVINGTSNLEGFGINLSGLQNRVVHNRIFSDNRKVHGGVVLHLVSGEVRDNEVVADRIGLLMNAKVGQSILNAKVEGNSLKVLGVPNQDSRKKPIYSLAIPSLNPGHFSIGSNYLEGSVMVGADPISTLSIHKKELMEISKEAIYYNLIKHDSSTYNFMLLSKLIPPRYTSPTEIEPKVLAVLSNFKINHWNPDPHRDRPIIHFTNNRVVRGWTAIAQSAAGAYLTVDELKEQPNKSLILQLSNNVFDYWTKVVGYDLIITGNHNQGALQYRNGRKIEKVANIPEPEPF
ncbi:hypothetical protein SCALIN_C05_0222 [Candidatus Scalindua japonica]|uniref:Right handed beta helix domain-containing protein n=1 Tax=Candidatus Scalindua japonica TaxID=1284222 RepID=A0A286TW68_9BACT|nr:DUF6519 domain-containing protein [Candidatus Scalindua japonica]GAX60137.1 hypothetical protein SCALIN_C05_0222 [Candidatus Scalindua japonica]